MNYYIQGDAAKADQIKAAFERNGIDTSANSNYGISNLFYYSYNGEVAVTQNRSIINIIKTHPDYQELELPVEPKFKVGDWITDGNITVQIEDIRNNSYIYSDGVLYSTRTADKVYHLWSIADAKDGDVLVTTKIRNCPFIYRKTSRNNGLAYYYAGVDGDGNFCEGCLKRTLYHFGSVENVVPATKKQRDLLFAKMRDAGYQWDADKKKLRKIKSHYDIANFYAGMPVLVRDYDNSRWSYVQFSHYVGECGMKFNACGIPYIQCIPFEGNEHLLGTTDMCDERFINW